MLLINGPFSMRLLYLANSRLPTEKAHGWQIIKTIEALQKQGVEITLVAPRRRNTITDSLENYYNLAVPLEITYIPNVCGWLETYWQHAYFILQRLTFGFLAFAYVLFSRADAIYSRDITICFWLSLVGKNIIFEDHEPKKRWRWLYRWFIKTIPKKVIVAQALENLYQREGVDAHSYIVAPNGVDIEAFANVSADKNVWTDTFGFKPDEPAVLYVGHFYAWKGVYTLLDAAKFIKGMIILIGGIPQDRQKVESYILEKKLTNVRVHEFIPHAEIIKFIKSADVLVLPNTAREERSAKYTTPIKLFEYMASNVPIVASNVESFQGYLKNNENALLCEPDNSADLAEKINMLLNNRVLARTLAQAVSGQARGYDWQERAKKIVKFIDGDSSLLLNCQA